jgi:hypothetical protein
MKLGYVWHMHIPYTVYNVYHTPLLHARICLIIRSWGMRYTLNIHYYIGTICIGYIAHIESASVCLFL